MSGVKVVLQRIHRALEGCSELLPSDLRTQPVDLRTVLEAAVSVVHTASRQDAVVVTALELSALALKSILVFPDAGSLEDACMGASLRELILGSGVVPDLMSAFAELWSITSVDDLPALSEVRPRTARMGVHARAWVCGWST
jgi:hypothetical protein